MSDSIQFLVDRLRSEGEKTAARFAALGGQDWALPVYTDGATWTVRSLLAHFVSSERAMCRLIQNVADGGPGAAEDFDIDRFNASEQNKIRELAPPELLNRFGAARGETIACVAQLTGADLQKQGRHPYLGMVSLEDMIKVVYRHTQLHWRDVRQVLPTTNEQE